MFFGSSMAVNKAKTLIYDFSLLFQDFSYEQNITNTMKSHGKICICFIRIDDQANGLHVFCAVKKISFFVFEANDIFFYITITALKVVRS